AHRLPVGEVEQVLAVAAVADEDEPRPVPLSSHAEAEAVAVADLLPGRPQLGQPLRHPPFVRLPPDHELRIEADAGVVEEATAVDVADVDAADDAGGRRLAGRLQVLDAY